ncbi:ATP-binding protein [Rhizosaccharibacter radicis]|uniref:histidine kinase n=1 Tax=Rhizosaccharibacter radicis TaxID=2782605 RepID=A0ABT1VZZ5_9PROT|nr:ATP-binding protein [Acetobacteraceae bacterium KSS12]
MRHPGRGLGRSLGRGLGRGLGPGLWRGPGLFLWPRGLVGRVTLVLLAAVLLEFTGSTVFYEQAETYTADDARIAHKAEQLATDLQLLTATAPARRAETARLMSVSDLHLEWDPASRLPLTPPEMLPLQARFAAQLREFGQEGLQLTSTPRPGDVAGALPLPDGTVLRFVSRGLMSRHPVTRGLLSAAVLAGCVLLAAAMLVRTLSQPLRLLARAADAIGRGPPVPVSEAGPREVRDLARAMNAMQDRIGRLIADRTEALAAVSHDLRTPLSRLRLRAGFLEDSDIQTAIEADVDEMESMVVSVLAYLAGEDDPEPRRNLDLAALLATLVDDAADAGRDARYEGPDHASMHGRPLALKRVFGNLISNALAYAGNVRVSLREEGAGLSVRVEDDGPGIPPAELDRVLTPFYRVEGSRSRATGGLGLGLAIVQREVQRENGVLRLSNRPEGGLRAEIVFKAGRPPS